MPNTLTITATNDKGTNNPDYLGAYVFTQVGNVLTAEGLSVDSYTALFTDDELKYADYPTTFTIVTFKFLNQRRLTNEQFDCTCRSLPR